MLSWIMATLKDLDLGRLPRALNDVAPAERRSGVLLRAAGAAVGAVLMYFFDRTSGGSRRASAREGLTNGYRSGRAQIDRAWRRLRSEGRTFDRSFTARVRDHPAAAPDGRPSREEAGVAAR